MKSANAGIRHLIFSAILMSLALSTGNTMADDSNLTMTDLSNWLDAYGQAWESRDADAAATIFSEDATYQVTPYEEPHRGQDGVRDYWAGVTENQRNVRFEHEAISVSGNTGIAHWSATFDVAPDGPKLELNGIFVLEFDENGKVRQLREWWHLKSQEAGEPD